MKLDAKLESAVQNRAEKIKEIDDNLFGDIIGVVEAIGRLKDSLDKIDVKLGERALEETADLGYRDVASNFIFLQRVLGALKDSCYDRIKLVQDIAFETKYKYEEVEPQVNAKLNSLQPRLRTTND